MENIEIATHADEMAIARESFSSPVAFDTAKTLIGFPGDVAGLWTLDVGGGASMVSSELRRRGAHAYALDYRYRDMGDLKRSVDAYLQKPFKKIEEEERALAQSNLPPVLVRAERKRLAAQRMISQSYVKTQRQARDAFFGTIESQKPYLIPGLAGELPFPDNTFDFVFSIQVLTYFLIRDRETFFQGVNESLRVLKPGGQLQMQPWMGSPASPWDSQSQALGRELLNQLRQQGNTFRVVQTIAGAASPRIEITRARAA